MGLVLGVHMYCLLSVMCSIKTAVLFPYKHIFISSFAAYGDVCVSMRCHHPPFCYISGGLEEASVVVLLQALLGLCDEGAGALQTLATVCNLLSQLAQLHHLEDTQIQSMLFCSDTLICIHSPVLSLEGTLFCWLDSSNFCLSNEKTNENTNCTFPDLVQSNHRFFFFFSFLLICMNSQPHTVFHHFQNSDASSSLVLLIFYAHLLWLKIALLMANSHSLHCANLVERKCLRAQYASKNASEIRLNAFTVRSPSATATVP